MATPTDSPLYRPGDVKQVVCGSTNRCASGRLQQKPGCGLAAPRAFTTFKIVGCRTSRNWQLSPPCLRIFCAPLLLLAHYGRPISLRQAVRQQRQRRRAQDSLGGPPPTRSGAGRNGFRRPSAGRSAQRVADEKRQCRSYCGVVSGSIDREFASEIMPPISAAEPGTGFAARRIAGTYSRRSAR